MIAVTEPHAGYERESIDSKRMRSFLEGKRVLLAGVNEVDTMLLNYMIHEGGAYLNSVQTKAELENILHKNRFDLIILNMRLENDNALPIAQKFKRELNLDTPLLGLSSTSLSGRGLHHGFSYIIRRPLEKKKVLAALERIFAFSQS